MTQLSFKLFKKASITKATKENTQLHRFELRMPTNEEKLDTLVAIGISSNQKSGKIENKTNKKLTF